MFARGNDAVFVGKAREKQGGDAIHGGYEDDGWYTLMWSREGDAWKLVFRGWQRAGDASNTQVWNHIFENKLGFQHKLNKLLVEYASKHAPGAAIDVAVGQGRNALYLACAGWAVTGVDISDEGIRQARAEATTHSLKLDTVVSDVTTCDYGVAKWEPSRLSSSSTSPNMSAPMPSAPSFERRATVPTSTPIRPSAESQGGASSLMPPNS